MLAIFALILSIANAQQFTSFTVAPPVYLEPNQTGLTFYTGQNMNLSWTSEGLATNQTVKLNYLTTALIQNTGNYTARISDTAAQLVNQSIIISVSNNASISFNSTPVSVIQSKILYVTLYTNLTNPVGTSTIPCGQNVTVRWQGLGQAGSGLTTVTIRSSGGGGGTTVGTPLTVLAQNGLMVMNYLLPASFVPSGFSTYSATVTSGTYTLSSQGFRLAAASPTPTSTPTSSRTPTPTPSLGSTSSVTPTSTPTPSLSFGSTASTTPSQTPSTSLSSSLTSSSTPSETASSTPTPTTPINLGAIAAAASQQSMNLVITVVASIGGILVACGVGFIVYRVQSHKQMRERRLRTAAAISSRMNDINTVYGVSYVRKEPMQAYKSSKILTVK